MTKAAERNRRYRDKKRGGPPRRPIMFWERVEKSAGCWAWMGPRGPQGYGGVWFQGKHWRAHRLAWYLATGDAPGHLDVLHRCDNPSCVRPDHLFIGTDVDNATDREFKGRGNHHEGHSRTKLTASDASSIRRLYRKGSSVHGGPALARRFGIHHSRVYSILRGEAWKCHA